MMKIGTKSMLYGAHQFLLHPLFVALAWWRIYGFPFDIRLWFAFYLHDIGYIGKPNMDGPEGETHPEVAAKLMAWLFGPKWGDFCRYHSRFAAKRDGAQFSRLCVADKLSISLTPAWLYLPMVNATGEIVEYMAMGKQCESNSKGVNKYESMKLRCDNQREWYQGVQQYLKRWVDTHKDLRPDTWTPVTHSSNRQPINEAGVWK
jgi:hypothetical protein